VRAYLPVPQSEAARRALRRRLSTLPLSAPLPRLRYREVAEYDWASEWRRFYDVQRLGQRIVIRPSWEAYEPRAGELVIALDPGAAFGTGQHESTRLCVAALEQGVSPGAAVLDVGTGSGILAIVAARVGAGSVRALDVDADVIVVARANAIRAGVAGQVVVAQGSIGSAWPWPHPQALAADVTVANISASTIVELMPALAETLRPGGLLILAGFLYEAEPTVAAAVQSAGLFPLRSDGEGEWRCLTVARRAAG
jgi:ribosomal protein L11 methyltransferase